MNSTKGKSCGLCFKSTNGVFSVTGEVMKDILDVLFLQVLNINGNSFLCQQCLEVTKKCLYFKMICLNTERSIFSRAMGMKDVTFKLTAMFKDNQSIETEWKDFSVCRFCMRQSERMCCVSFDLLIEELTFGEMLPVFLREMDLKVVDDPVSCTSCREDLECYFNFVYTCLRIRNQLNQQEKNINNMEHVDIGLTHIKNEMEISRWKPRIHCEVYKNLVKMEKGIDNKCATVENRDIVNESLQRLEGKFVACTYETKQRSHKDASKAKTHKCESCPYKTRYKSCLQKHFVIHKDPSEVQMYRCDSCTYETKHKRSIASHVLIHASDKAYKCEICTYETKRRDGLKKHAVIHQDISQVIVYKCQSCAYETNNKSRLGAHQIVHKDNSEVKTYKCETCTFETKWKRCFKKHNENHEVASAQTHKCTICTYETKDKGVFKSHLAAHTDKFKCTLCTFATKYKSSLKSHMLMHKDASEMKLYHCVSCPFETKRKNSLNVHKKIHMNASELTMFKCDSCTYETKWKDRLKLHLLIHKDNSKVTIYKCTVCDYEAKRKYRLKQHVVVHKDKSEVRTYKCEQCTFETKYKTGVKKHMAVHKNV